MIFRFFALANAPLILKIRYFEGAIEHSEEGVGAMGTWEVHKVNNLSRCKLK